MTGKDLVIAAMKGEVTERPAWVPFVGTHGGSLIGATATEYLQSADKLVEGLTKAKELYRPDGLPIVFDLQMEAEILGCDLHWADDGPPSVTSHPLEESYQDEEEIDLSLIPEFDITKGRFPLAFEATRRLKAQWGDEVALYGLICGPFTLALHLLGNDIFIAMFDDEDAVNALIARCAEIGNQVIQGYLDAGCDIVAVVDPMVSQISPEHFEQFVAPHLNAQFDYIRAQGGLSSLFVCGDATKNLAVMCDTRCDGISIDENVPLEALVPIARDRKTSMGGNLMLTVTLLLGTEHQCQLDAIRCMDICGTEGFILAPGCDLPYAVPPENLRAVAEVVHDEYKREIARNTAVETKDDPFDDVVIPNYASEPNVIVDLVTLNGETCAPCQYMVEGAKAAAVEAAKTLGTVEVHEHRVTGRDGLGYMTKLGVSNIPTICIDGVPTFISLIPDQNTLVEAIRKAAEKKSVKA